MRTILIDSPTELADYNDQWESLRRETGANAYNNCLLSRIWLETFKDAASPRVILVEDGGELIGIAPLASSNLKIKGLSFKTLALIGGVPNSLRLVTNSIMYRPERKDALKEIVKAMKHMKWSFLWTQNMDDTGAIQQYIGEATATWHAQVQKPNINLVLPLKETGDIAEGFSRQGKKNLKKSAKLAAEEGRSIDYRLVPPEDIDRAIEIYAKQHIERWTTRGGSSFSNPFNCEFLRRATSISYEGGGGFAYEFLVDKEVAGQLIGFTDGDKVYMYRLGMNDAFMRYSPGWLIYTHALMDLRDKGIRSCIMGGGEQRFKYEMGGQEALLVGVQATRGAASVVDSLMRSRTMQRLDSKLGLTNKAISALSVEGTEQNQSSPDSPGE